MRAWPVLAWAVALFWVGSCSQVGHAAFETGRDSDGRVLTGTVLDLPDDGLGDSSPLVVMGETPWGAIYACPAGDVTLAVHTGGASVADSGEDATGLVRAYLARLGLDIETVQMRLMVVPPERQNVAAVVVAVTWLEGELEPVAAWFSIAGPSISGYRGCNSWFAAASG